ncbi:unnamed protein product, partial [Enterobius vermicularis]|uniref:NPC1_N domain-containing protein n=1 Tax=Enterobius vermicularis TaxID=51028 RepID=A0A0N4UYY4_ENTVE
CLGTNEDKLRNVPADSFVKTYDQNQKIHVIEKLTAWFDTNNARYQFPPACCPQEIRDLSKHYCPTISRYNNVSYNVTSSFQLISAFYTVRLKRQVDKEILYLY